MRIDLSTPIKNQWWKNTYLYSAGGTVSADFTDSGLTGGNLDHILLNGRHDFANRLQGCRILEYGTIYSGLSENITRRDLAKITTDLSDAVLENLDCQIMVACGTDAFKQIARKTHKRLNQECIRRNIKMTLLAANRPLHLENTDGWDNFRTCLIGGHLPDMEPGVYGGFHGDLIKADEIDYLPFVDSYPFYDTEMHLDSENSSQFSDRKALINEFSLDEIEALKLGNIETDQILVLEACHTRNSLEKIDKEIESKNPKVVVLRLYHSGTACTHENKPLANWAHLVKKWREKGIIFFGVTNNGEPTDLTLYETSTALREAGVIPGFDLLPKVAIAKASYAAIKGMKPADCIDFVLPASKMVSNNKDKVDALKVLYS